MKDIRLKAGGEEERGWFLLFGPPTSSAQPRVWGRVGGFRDSMFTVPSAAELGSNYES